MAWLPGWVFLCLSCAAAGAASSEDGVHWCYLSQKCQDPHCKEPRQWDEITPSACGGKQQSPINIVTSKIEYDWNLLPFHFEKYNAEQASDWHIVNNGHTVQVNLDGSAKISSGGLSGKYKAMQFHFHWGNDAEKSSRRLSPGSEHSIDGERYPMELHIVHIKENYASLSDALQGNGVAVLGFFIEVGKYNENYAPLLSQLSEIPFNGNNKDMPPLRLDSLIPKADDLTSFYRYTGSLTTPACNENVVWTLFEKPIELQLGQIQEFWMQLYFGTTKNDSWIVDNFRPTQPLGDRIVFKSDSNAFLPPAKLFLLIPTAACFSLSLLQ
ncbi:carbonic anhydrase 4 [Anolis carolinensis]|uniref:Carbonic anhydrase n=1 Tax=Anolis carolinensis TaxID=28377 RepID=H9GLZ6_ANOCA|nr:PREDICTED: carbonic anhydrase 4 [Anolis carolinensis]|eukprot:XP_008117670.1 PREDICTED: carbonic anhydrase 4 [Anolis carolinensis]